MSDIIKPELLDQWLGEVQAAGDKSGRAKLRQLTPGELLVLTNIMQGVKSASIAHRLNCSQRTVEKRRQSIFLKTKTFSVAELVRLVLEAA